MAYEMYMYVGGSAGTSVWGPDCQERVIRNVNWRIKNKQENGHKKNDKQDLQNMYSTQKSKEGPGGSMS